MDGAGRRAGGLYELTADRAPSFRRVVVVPLAVVVVGRQCFGHAWSIAWSRTGCNSRTPIGGPGLGLAGHLVDLLSFQRVDGGGGVSSFGGGVLKI